MTQRRCHRGGGLRCRCERPGHGASVGHHSGGPLAVGEPLGRAVGRGLEAPACVEDEACGRGADPRGSGVGAAGLEACGDDADGAAIGGGPAPGLFPDESPVSASVRPVTAATSTAAPATIKRTPWRNLISSSRA
ncbi:hypothetical protein OG417_35020 [Actinoallomurus sp. NBC_01490]|uniref:hypothetical protein n=1 Tax=Actinoallomurus sp. NBC_01490 TaxID=2903557 RepID=UPI002E370B15|nr:hypothetical protein [Actinoallomurus sp. NBC_01490]